MGLALSWRTRSVLLGISVEYPCSEVPSEGLHRSQALVIGGLVLPGSFAVARLEKGLYLAPGPWLSKLGAAPVEIPWNVLQLERQGRGWSTLRWGTNWLGGPSQLLQLPASEPLPE